MSDATFEQNMSKLDQLVDGLEKGDLPLEECLKAYQQGMELVKQCKAQLEAAELRVRKIVDESGATEPFESDV